MSKNSKPIIISGSTNKEVASQIAGIIGCELIPINLEKFSDGEIGTEILETVRGKKVFLIQTSIPNQVNDNLIETGLIADALSRAGCEEWNLVQLIHPYQRQDRREKKKEENKQKRRPVSARFVASYYEELCRFSSVVCVHLHSEQIEGFYKEAYIENIPSTNLFLEYLNCEGILNNSNHISFAGPDIGSVKVVSDVSEVLDYDYAIIDKRRSGPGKSKAIKIIGDVKGRIVLLIDDQLDTGGTIIGATEKLLEMGAVAVYAMFTHYIGSGNAIQNLLNSPIKKIITTDTIPNHEILKYPERFVVLPIAPLIADVITRIFNNQSLQQVVAYKTGIRKKELVD